MQTEAGKHETTTSASILFVHLNFRCRIIIGIYLIFYRIKAYYFLTCLGFEIMFLFSKRIMWGVFFFFLFGLWVFSFFVLHSFKSAVVFKHDRSHISQVWSYNFCLVRVVMIFLHNIYSFSTVGGSILWVWGWVNG